MMGSTICHSLHWIISVRPAFMWTWNINKVHVSIFLSATISSKKSLTLTHECKNQCQQHFDLRERFDADAPELCKSFEATFFPRPDWTHAQVKPVHVSIPSMQCNNMENKKHFFSKYRVKFAQTISNTSFGSVDSKQYEQLTIGILYCFNISHNAFQPDITLGRCAKQTLRPDELFRWNELGACASGWAQRFVHVFWGVDAWLTWMQLCKLGIKTNDIVKDWLAARWASNGQIHQSNLWMLWMLLGFGPAFCFWFSYGLWNPGKCLRYDFIISMLVRSWACRGLGSEMCCCMPHGVL